MTNDGDFAYRVTHPKFELGKTYVATVGAGLTIAGLNKLRRGVRLEEFKTSPAEVELLNSDANKAVAS